MCGWRRLTRGGTHEVPQVPRRERRFLLPALEECGQITEDMLRWKIGSAWREILHPFEYTDRYPKVCEPLRILRNDRPFSTFNSQVRIRFTGKEFSAAPGPTPSASGDVCPAAGPPPTSRRWSGGRRVRFLRNVAEQGLHAGPAPGLHTTSKPGRVERVPRVFPEGERRRRCSRSAKGSTATPDGVAVGTAGVCEQTLARSFSKLPPLGKVYLDERLKNYSVPFSQRSASKSLRTLVRGSRLPLPDCTTLRFFVWWKNGKAAWTSTCRRRCTTRISGTVGTLAYYNLKNFGAHHSGDIVDAPKGRPSSSTSTSHDAVAECGTS